MEKEEIFSKKIIAGPNRTYFLDVKKQRNGSVYLQFSESFKRSEFDLPNRSRIIIHKEDFSKIEEGFTEVLNYIKNELINYFLPRIDECL